MLSLCINLALPDWIKICKRKEQYCILRYLIAVAQPSVPPGTDKIQTGNNLAGGNRANLSSTSHPLFVMQHLYLSAQHPYLSAQCLPHPFLSCATPLFSYRYTTPLLSYATYLLFCYATPLLSYAAPLLSYATPLRYYTTPLFGYTTPLLS